ADVPDNGIDEDCSGTDAVDADRDHDGTPRPQDCNDGDAAIRPGVAEVIGNDVDENCDGRSDPFPPVIGSVSTAWRGGGRVTRNVALRLKKFADSTKIELRCSGRRCPFKKVRRTFGSRRTVDLHRFFKGRALRPGTKIELRLTVARRVGRVLRWTMRSPGGSPDVRFLCLPPGGRPQGC
ncbi:MAG TPA: MopE-related protein, partial [Solirubrobacter sp.]|nr:MopE-related protein [Solirubrobacter sp.]